jgi:hypothetical protein
MPYPVFSHAFFSCQLQNRCNEVRAQIDIRLLDLAQQRRNFRNQAFFFCAQQDAERADGTESIDFSDFAATQVIVNNLSAFSCL